MRVFDDSIDFVFFNLENRTKVISGNARTDNFILGDLDGWTKNLNKILVDS